MAWSIAQLQCKLRKLKEDNQLNKTVPKYFNFEKIINTIHWNYFAQKAQWAFVNIAMKHAT